MYVFETTSVQIAYEISMEDFNAIDKRDQDRQDEDNWDNLSTLLDRIEGVSDTDYNGHFGLFLYFTIDAEHNTPEKRVEIGTLIFDYKNGTGEFA